MITWLVHMFPRPFGFVSDPRHDSSVAKSVVLERKP